MARALGYDSGSEKNDLTLKDFAEFDGCILYWRNEVWRFVRRGADYYCAGSEGPRNFKILTRRSLSFDLFNISRRFFAVLAEEALIIIQ